MKSKIIYLDHASTTPLDPRVFTAMRPWLTEEFGNPSALYGLGQRAKFAVEEARRTVAEILRCEPSEIIFTSGGTESDNLALRGVLAATSRSASRRTGGHILTVATEHHAVLSTAEDLAKTAGNSLTILPVDRFGRVSVAQIEQNLKANTKLVSVILANNEIGTLQPVRAIGKMLQKKRERGEKVPLLHTDAVQAGGVLELDVRHLKVDLLSLSGHKFYGPKGVGILFVKNGVPLQTIQTGGGQEREQRGGTENVAGIVGIAAALKLAEELRKSESARLAKLRDYLIERVLTEIPKSRLNGHPTERLPGNANFSFHGIEGESILLRLDFEGIAASSGSACTSSSLDPSHVLTALKIGVEWLHGSLRLTLGRSTRRADLTKTVTELKKIVQDLRSISPL